MGGYLLSELKLEELMIMPLLLQEGIMGSPLNHLPVLEHEDLIDMFDG
jgi:hypothetical protein